MATVLITGASSGIGKEFAYECAKRGYDLIITARRGEILNEMADELQKNYAVTCTVIVQDLSEDYAANKIVSEIDRLRIGVDILINNAGFATKGLLSDSDYDMLHRELHVNIIALTELTYLLIGKMAESEHAAVINISSAAAFNPVPYNDVYAATKAYVLSFSQSISYEYKDRGVSVIAVCPQATDTHFFDNINKMDGKMRKASDVVKTTFQALERNKVVVTDGFGSFLQSLMPHFLSRKMCVRITGAVGKKIWG